MEFTIYLPFLSTYTPIELIIIEVKNNNLRKFDANSGKTRDNIQSLWHMLQGVYKAQTIPDKSSFNSFHTTKILCVFKNLHETLKSRSSVF